MDTLNRVPRTNIFRFIIVCLCSSSCSAFCSATVPATEELEVQAHAIVSFDSAPLWLLRGTGISVGKKVELGFLLWHLSCSPHSRFTIIRWRAADKTHLSLDALEHFAKVLSDSTLLTATIASHMLSAALLCHCCNRQVRVTVVEIVHLQTYFQSTIEYDPLEPLTSHTLEGCGTFQRWRFICSPMLKRWRGLGLHPGRGPWHEGTLSNIVT